MTSPVLWQTASSSPKLSPVERREVPGNRRRQHIARAPYCAATYVSIEATCPKSCPWYGGACYVTAAATVATNNRLDAAAEELTADEVIELEAERIERSWYGGPIPQDGARGGRDLRLHVGGDTPSPAAARRLARAVRNWHDRGGGDAWTYTHRWRGLRRSHFGPISALASVETVPDAHRARRRGFVPAITVAEHPSEKAYDLDGLRVIPCPQQTRGRSCVECRLCLDDDRLRELGVAISFALHGTRVKKARRQLRVLRSAPAPKDPARLLEVAGFHVTEARVPGGLLLKVS